MISLVSALVIERGEKKIETERVAKAGSKKVMLRGVCVCEREREREREREGKLEARDRKMKTTQSNHKNNPT